MSNLLSGLSNTLDETTATGKRILNWQGEPAPEKDALALRLAGGLHALVRRGCCPKLAPYYQNTERATDHGFIPLVLAAIAENDQELLSWLDFAPQTNEVARAAIIYSGLCVAAKQFDMPIALYELGASGGLNLQAASFEYNFAGKSYGSRNSKLCLVPEWSGNTPPAIYVDVVGGQGCDLNPLSVEVAQDREKLIAYLWPDQHARIERVTAAIDIARSDRPSIDRSDAATWVEKTFAEAGKPGVLRVLFHTIAWNYFPDETKGRITNAMQSAGKRSSEDRPLAWLSFEFEDSGRPELKLRVWPGDTQKTLAIADPHVRSIEWLE